MHLRTAQLITLTSFTDLYNVFKECQRSLVGIEKKNNLHSSKLKLPNKECGMTAEVIPEGNLKINVYYCNVTLW